MGLNIPMHGIQKACVYSYTELQLCSECQRPQNGECGISRNVGAYALVRNGILKSSRFTIVGGKLINLGIKFSTFFWFNISPFRSHKMKECVWKMNCLLYLGMMISPEMIHTG